MQTVTQPSLSSPDRSASTEHRDALIVRLWQRLGERFGIDRWARERGPVDGEQFREWSEGLARYSTDQIARGLRSVVDAQLDGPVTLSRFAQLCLTGGSAPTEQQRPVPAVPGLRAHTDVGRRELERQERIATSSRSRTPSAGDVESFADSYHKCGLGNRWPGGKVAM